MEVLSDAFWQAEWDVAAARADQQADVDGAVPLVVAHAQHPLEAHGHPGADMRQRLDKAAAYYEHVNGQARIYVPGSRHGADPTSLSAAGTAYLAVKHGIDPTRLHGDDWNKRYRPDGVYNGADEAYVAAAAFHQETAQRLGRLVVAASPEQSNRLWLHYLANETSPTFLPVTADSSEYHASTAETALTMYTRRLNPDWQSGVIPAAIRRSRRPR